MRLAVTGVTGRLGGAVVELARRRPGWEVVAWDRRAFDLDAPETAGASLDADRPDLVVHCAAWTDVDGCARQPDLAAARNGRAAGDLARACASRDIGLVVVSTNEVFDGTRTDRRPYLVTDPVSPANAYGRSKAIAEAEARDAYATAAAPLWVARTAWLYGAPGRDFPTKIVEAAGRARLAGTPLQLVADEIGCPTLARDLAAGILALAEEPGSAGVHHVVNAGHASRATWARRVLAELGIDVATEDVPLSTWQRPSRPPAWGVLGPTELPGIGWLRDWDSALAEDVRGRDLALAAAERAS